MITKLVDLVKRGKKHFGKHRLLCKVLIWLHHLFISWVISSELREGHDAQNLSSTATAKLCTLCREQFGHSGLSVCISVHECTSACMHMLLSADLIGSCVTVTSAAKSTPEVFSSYKTLQLLQEALQYWHLLMCHWFNSCIHSLFEIK